MNWLERSWNTLLLTNGRGLACINRLLQYIDCCQLMLIWTLFLYFAWLFIWFYFSLLQFPIWSISPSLHHAQKHHWSSHANPENNHFKPTFGSIDTNVSSKITRIPGDDKFNLPVLFNVWKSSVVRVFHFHIWIPDRVQPLLGFAKLLSLLQ